MKPHHRRLYQSIATLFQETSTLDHDSALLKFLHIRLSDGHSALDIECRVRIQTLCRVIDVQGKLPAELGSSTKAPGNGKSANAIAAAGMIAVLLASASAADAERGWALKCANTALKALDLTHDFPDHPALVAWAIEIIERKLESDSAL